MEQVDGQSVSPAQDLFFIPRVLKAVAPVYSARRETDMTVYSARRETDMTVYSARRETDMTIYSAVRETDMTV